MNAMGKKRVIISKGVPGKLAFILDPTCLGDRLATSSRTDENRRGVIGLTLWIYVSPPVLGEELANESFHFDGVRY